MPERVLKASALDRLKGTFRDSAGVLLPAIQRHVMRTQESLDVRPDDHSLLYMHPSDMARNDWCPRHDFYRMTNTPIERKGGRNPSFQMENIFAEGHTIALKYTNWMWEMGILVGDFRCKECGHRWGARSPSECQFCRSDRLEYKEYPLHRERLRVEGHADAAIHLPEVRSLVEIKSIGTGTLRFEAPRLHNRYLAGERAEDIWLSITHPFASHMRQGQLYLWMAWPVYEQIIFIYESKLHQQTKEFVVEYNKSYIATLLEQAKEAAQGYRAGIPPDRPHWVAGPSGKICASCPYRNTCWETADADEETPPAPGPRVLRATRSKRRSALSAASI